MPSDIRGQILRELDATEWANGNIVVTDHTITGEQARELGYEHFHPNVALVECDGKTYLIEGLQT